MYLEQLKYQAPFSHNFHNASVDLNIEVCTNQDKLWQKQF